MRCVLLSFAVLAGCGRIGFDDVPDGADAPPDACRFGPFGTPRNLTELNSAEMEYGPWLSEDKLDLYFSSQVTGASVIYHASRASKADSFGTPLPLSNLVTQGFADDPVLSDDGLQVIFENSVTTLGKDQQLEIAIRSNTAVEFANGQLLANVNDAMTSDSAASLTSDGLTMVFSSMRAGTSDLYLATRPTLASAFGTPIRIDSLDTLAFECCSSLSSDGSSMVFISDASGTRRIVQSVRVNGTYQPPVELDPGLAGPTGDEVDPMLTRDGTTIVFSSTRVGGAGVYDLYIAERSCL